MAQPRKYTTQQHHKPQAISIRRHIKSLFFYYGERKYLYKYELHFTPSSIHLHFHPLPISLLPPLISLWLLTRDIICEKQKKERTKNALCVTSPIQMRC
jgi:hypothetical protein